MKTLVFSLFLFLNVQGMTRIRYNHENILHYHPRVKEVINHVEVFKDDYHNISD